jgi:hypothetical protein
MLSPSIFGSLPSRRTRPASPSVDFRPPPRVGTGCTFVEVDCDEATIRERLRARQEGRSVSDAREALLPLFRRRYRAPDELSRAERLTVDGRADPPDTARAVRERLG